ncbi:MAG: ATP-binding cassette domain-containing protein [Lachnospiraceae bacterium]
MGHQSYLFKGTVRENLLIGNRNVWDEQLWEVLERVRLAEFLRGEDGLDTQLLERGSNFSGGQRQRLALARALLHDSPVYIFDEAASNIDVESENAVMQQIRELAKCKTVILISHRLENVVLADCIYVLDGGRVEEYGTHTELLEKKNRYAQLWHTQQDLENYTEGGNCT